MEQKENFQILCDALQLILPETQRNRYLPEWLYQFWQNDSSNVSHLKDGIRHIRIKLDQDIEPALLETKLIRRLDRERYLAVVHLHDHKLRSRVQDALIAALFFSTDDVNKYREWVLAEQNPRKFVENINRRREVEDYKSYLAKQHSIYGMFIKNFTEEELTLAAKDQVINGKLLDYFKLDEYLKHGFGYVKHELKALEMNKIEKGYLTIDRMTSYLEKISFLLHPANELHADTANLVKSARYLLEDIINTAGVSEPGKPEYEEHTAIIQGCYWIDEMFKVATSYVDIQDEIVP